MFPGLPQICKTLSPAYKLTNSKLLFIGVCLEGIRIFPENDESAVVEASAVLQEFHEGMLETGPEGNGRDSVPCGLDSETTEDGVGFAGEGKQVGIALESQNIGFFRKDFLKLRIEEP